MPAITLKNIPDDLYVKIKKSAEVNFRSINSEILFRLKTSISQNKPEVKLLLDQIREVRNKIHIPKLNDKILCDAKNEGRL